MEPTINCAVQPVSNLARLAGQVRMMPIQSTHGGIEAEKAAKIRELREVTTEFEAIFVRQLFSSMRSTIPGDGMFGSGSEGEIYGDMMDNAIGEVISRRGNLKIGDMLFNRLVKQIDPDYGVNPATRVENAEDEG